MPETPAEVATAALAKAVDDLDKVSQRLARAGGMALTTGLTELVSLIGDAGCDLDDVINDLQDLVDCPGCGALPDIPLPCTVCGREP